MQEEKRFSADRGAEGCLVSLLCMLILMLPLVCGLTFSNKRGYEIYSLLVWHIAICVGGYFAARRGRTTGWTNSLAVGVLAEVYLAVKLLDIEEGGLPAELGSTLRRVVDAPSQYWRLLVKLVLTIPAAILGGIIWQKSRVLERSVGKEELASVKETDRSKE